MRDHSTMPLKLTSDRTKAVPANKICVATAQKATISAADCLRHSQLLCQHHQGAVFVCWSYGLRYDLLAELCGHKHKHSAA